MAYDDPTTQLIGTALDELLDALEASQDETDRPALQLVQLAAVDVHDARDTLDAEHPDPITHAAADLADAGCWLAAYRTDQPDLVTILTTFIDTATAKISNEVLR